MIADETIILIIIIVAIIIILLITKSTKTTKNKYEEYIQAIKKKLSAEDVVITVDEAEQLFKSYMRERYGEQAVQFYNSKLKAVTCSIPANFLLLQDDLFDTNFDEHERLRQCGYLYNVTLLSTILWIFVYTEDVVKYSFEGFKNLVDSQVASEQVIASEPTSPTGSRYYRF
jgi:hypothetical protein